jgi:hypothetical protein
MLLIKVTYTNSSSGAGYTAGCASATAGASPVSPACATTTTVISATASGTLTNSVCFTHTPALVANEVQALVTTVPAVTSCYVQSATVSTSAAYYTSQNCASTSLYCSVYKNINKYKYFVKITFL